jgi:acetyl-CoA C-acetyltransferase
LNERVAIIGIGIEGFRSQIRELSYKEMVYNAAVKAYNDADDLDPRTEVDTFISCEEDLNMGVSITDEYAPDQLGAAQRTVHTITDDGITGIAAGYMQIKTGLFDVAVIEAQSRNSDILTHNNIQNFSLDPLETRNFNVNYHFTAGLEKRAYMNDTKITEEMIAEVTVRNHKNALKNPYAAFGSNIDKEHVLSTEMISDPIREIEIAKPVDGAIVIVIAAEKIVKEKNVNPIWINGITYATNSPNFGTRNWNEAEYAKICSRKLYELNNITNPLNEIDIYEIDNTYSYKEFQHLEGLGIYEKGESGKKLLNDEYANINPSGGVLGMGNAHEANGLQRVSEIVEQLRGEAGRRQINGVEKGLAFSWRGLPTTSGAMMMMGVE